MNMIHIHFTKHAKEKFNILMRHAVHITEAEVIDTIVQPDTIDNSRLPLLIAQRTIDKSHVLRVVYKQERGVIIVITFYPGRKKQYE